MEAARPSTAVHVGNDAASLRLTVKLLPPVPLERVSYVGNAALLLNSVESVSSDVSLSEIRNKGSNFKPLRELSDSLKALTKWSNIIGLPILITIIGLIKFLLRSR